MSVKKLYQLEKFSTEVTREGDILTVKYKNGEFMGECTYIERGGMSRFQPQLVHLLTSSNMGDVIEYIHKESPLSSEDHNDLQMYIREHSLKVIQDHLRVQGL
jgi:hypothetical protein